MKRRAREAWRDLLAGEAPAGLIPLLFDGSARGRTARVATPIWRSARGMTVTDVDGRRYLDLNAGFGVAMLGHAHPAVVRAVRRQAKRLVHGFGDVHPHEERARLAAVLAKLVPIPNARILWAQHGAEAIELAWRTAYLATGRPGVLAFRGGYHGLSLGTLALTGWPEFRRPVAPLVPEHVYFAPYPPCARCRSGDFGCVEEAFTRALRAARPHGGLGAVLVEPVQGRGGQIVPPSGWLAAVARAAKRRGVLLIADEIYCGFGRTGLPFAVEHEGVRPDLICIGKGIASGLPLAVVAGRAPLMAEWRRAAPPGEAAHAATFMAHPLSCAAARATISIWRKRKLWRRAAAQGRLLHAELALLADRHPEVAEVRGRGLHAGLPIVDRRGRPDPGRCAAIVAAALRERLIVLGGGLQHHVLAMSPSLLVTDGERRRGLRRLARALESTRR